MAKVFTITPGLENMGAMKTGGQGSVYKGRRIGEIITAIKLLPTPIYSESEEDKNYRDFKNEVNKLKKVNEEPNPNVVKILSSGLSDTGNFPYIEMEYIEGPDLEDLLQPPHDRVFTIKEVIKVAEQLSSAIAHCHKKDIKHGDIKSNNVKYNIHSGNYVLLDFGLAVMTDEQRRTSLRKAGAVEFMAPEQNEGIMLAQTDVYSFGVIIFELLAGSVPFPLQDKGETARNNVRLAHLETLPPDLISLRREALPGEWPQDKKEREMKVPEWLINMIYKCLKKKPENRFANGLELHDYIIQNGVQTLQRAAVTTLSPTYGTDNNSGNKQMQEQLNLLRDKLDKKERELDQLKALLRSREGEVEALQVNAAGYDRLTREKGVSKGWFTALLLLTIAIAGFSAYTYMNNKKQSSSETSTSAPVTDLSDSDFTESTTAATAPQEPIRDDSAEAIKKAEALRKKHQLDSIRNAEKVKAAETAQQNEQNSNDADADVVAKEKDKQQSTPPPETEKLKSNSVQYMVVSKSYFYNSPDESTRRNTYIIPSNSAIVNAIEEQDGFVNVSFTNSAGQTIKGWVRKQTLQQINE